MENMNTWVLITLLALILFFVAAMAITVGYFLASSKTKNALLKQNETIFKRAQEQLQSWKEQELTTIKQQTFDAAKGQVIQEMQEQVQRWQQTEIQKIRQQLLEAVRGEAIRDAQEQLKKWRSEELENAKSQIWEVLAKESKVSLEQWKVDTEKGIRQDAIDKSHSVTVGKMTEHIVPYLPGFKFNPADARFIGSPIDFVVFDGLGDGEVRKVVFVEIKTGASNLSSRERSVRNAVLDRNVEWLEIKVNLDNPEIVQEYKSRRNNKRSE